VNIIRKRVFLEECISDKDWMFTDESTGNVHLLNTTANSFFRLCDNTVLDDIIEHYVEIYQVFGVSKDTLRNDALKIYDLLMEKNMIWEEDSNE
jgi:hypothetical protein